MGKLSKVFGTDGVAVAGNGAELVTGLLFWRPSRPITITGLAQVPGAVVANDADWNLMINGKLTGLFWPAEVLSPVNDGGLVDKVSIRLPAGSIIQFPWLGQAAAQINQLQVFYVE